MKKFTREDVINITRKLAFRLGMRKNEFYDWIKLNKEMDIKVYEENKPFIESIGLWMFIFGIILGCSITLLTEYILGL